MLNLARAQEIMPSQLDSANYLKFFERHLGLHPVCNKLPPEKESFFPEICKPPHSPVALYGVLESAVLCSSRMSLLNPEVFTPPSPQAVICSLGLKKP